MTKEEVIKTITTGKEYNGVLIKVDPLSLGPKNPNEITNIIITRMEYPVGIMFWYEAGNESPIEKRAITNDYDDLFKFVEAKQQEPTFVGWPE
jgi:hypothetical protein